MKWAHDVGGRRSRCRLMRDARESSRRSSRTAAPACVAVDREGRAWREAVAREHPHRRQQDGQVAAYRFAQWVPLADDAPVMRERLRGGGVQAWGRPAPADRGGVGVAAVHGAHAGDANLDHRHAGRSRPVPAATASAHLIGNVWEWTATPFAAYPTLRGRSLRRVFGTWFGDHRVIRGGSFATRLRLVHARFRQLLTAPTATTCSWVPHLRARVARFDVIH